MHASAPTQAIPETAPEVAAVRRFNRFYTRQVGALEKSHLGSPFSLAEVRVLYEIANGDGPSASDLRRTLGLDAGYASRIIARLTREGLIERAASPSDGRRSHLRLTEAGTAAFADLNRRAGGEVASMLSPLPPSERRKVVQAMRLIERLLATPADANDHRAEPYILRPPAPGDLGWVVKVNGELYAREYGWDVTYEALVAEIVASFARNFEPSCERCWIAERHGENVGSVFLVRHPERKGVAKLRLLIVDPSARGLGIGNRLVSECIRFARQVGHHTMTLWTNSVLVAARRIYEKEGFRLVSEEKHHSFGKDLVGQTWELTL